MISQSIHTKLERLADNLWWTWHPEIRSIFRDLNPTLFEELNHNPVALLNEISSEVLEARTADTTFHARVDGALRRLNDYLNEDSTWASTHAGPLRARPIAYFSAEFGIHESLPIYSGGLGVLAGDHLKSASDLGLPLIAIGLFYDQGYFRQRLSEEGAQIDDYVHNDPASLPMEPARTTQGEPVRIQLETRSGILHGRVWRIKVGRCTMLLIDSNVPENTEADRALTARLYGGDGHTRIRQELLLGVGGVRAMAQMGIDPGVFHLNEGHSAFATLEAVRVRMVQDGMDFEDAAREVAVRTVFTTHTPVPAGHDRFAPELVEETLGPLRESLELSEEELMDLGHIPEDEYQGLFNMTALAMKLSRFANGVSALHGRISRHMWQKVWPNRLESEVPIGHITNGVHVLTWLAPEMHDLYDRHFTPRWPQRMCVEEVWHGIDQVDDEELWETHRLLKVRLVQFVRQRLQKQRERGDSYAPLLTHADDALDPEVLTIGFARRFATYKRADLLFGDLDRLARMVSNSDQPVQFVFAGKAHPNDEGGKALIQKLVHIIAKEPFNGKIVFLENHDMHVGRRLVQGVDAWLNTPRRPMEASGTSGQKVLLNGILNISVLDGWWPEAYDGLNGFAIGTGASHGDPNKQDARDRDALFDVLEKEVIPLYYDRDSDGIPRRWIRRMKRAIRTLGWRFNTDRMVMDYALHAYIHAAGAATSDGRRR